MAARHLELNLGDGLIVADVQNDFLPGGSLGVPLGNEVIAPINRAIAIFDSRGLPIFATRDWHPADHCSFHARGGPWPPHCVAGTSGASFSPQLRLPAGVEVISKATTPEKDAYSAFEGTPLHDRLQAKGVSRLFLGGLATEYCILNTAKDAIRLGYRVFFLLDAIRAINVHPGDEQQAIAEMRSLGAIPETTAALASEGERRKIAS